MWDVWLMRVVFFTVFQQKLLKIHVDFGCTTVILNFDAVQITVLCRSCADVLNCFSLKIKEAIGIDCFKLVVLASNQVYS